MFRIPVSTARKGSCVALLSASACALRSGRDFAEAIQASLVKNRLWSKPWPPKHPRAVKIYALQKSNLLSICFAINCGGSESMEIMQQVVDLNTTRGTGYSNMGKDR